MKILLVLASEEIYKNVSHFLKPQGFELIWYRHVLKAMDNVSETDPGGIIISARDFPRHWKTMTGFVRYERSRDECPIVILRGSVFPMDECRKAEVLEVNALARDTLDNPAETEKLQALLAGYAEKKHAAPPDIQPEKPGEEKSHAPDTSGTPQSSFGFIFSHPRNGKIVTGKVTSLSAGGLFFETEFSGAALDIEPGMELDLCSLRAGESILSPVCAVRGTGGTVALEFRSFPAGEKETLDRCLKKAG